MIEQAIAFLAGAAGLFTVYHRLRRDFSIATSLLTTLLIFAATSLFWSMTSAAAPADALVFGAVGALALVTTRPGPRWSHIVAWITLLVLPTVVMWATSRSVSIGSSVFAPGDPLFSVARGFFSLTPVAYVAAVGTLLYARQQRAIGGMSLLAVLLWVASSSLLVTQAREPFDHRLTPALILLAPGLAHVIDAVRARPWLAVAPLVAIAPLWNYWLMVQYTAGMVPKDEPISFAAMVRQQADVHTRPPYVYPFAFPANVLFAWREGVPVDRYDVLARQPRGEQFELIFDRSADPFLLEGWGAIAAMPAGPLRWTAARRATLTFPLQQPPSDLAVDVIAATRGAEAASSPEFSIEINDHGVGDLNASTTPMNTHITMPAASVRQVVRDGYNRLTLINHGNRRLGVYKIRIGPAS